VVQLHTAMLLKTLKTHLNYTKRNSSGFTLFELIIGIAIITILAIFLIIVLKPQILYAETRDKKRISDLSTLERMFVEAKVDTGSYPGLADTTYYSNTLPSGALGPLANSAQGWLGTNTNLTAYYPKLPIDPTNDTTYRYIYRHNGTSYEIRVQLESNAELMTNDGGDDSTYYELGSDLTLL